MLVAAYLFKETLKMIFFCIYLPFRNFSYNKQVGLYLIVILFVFYTVFYVKQ